MKNIARPVLLCALPVIALFAAGARIMEHPTNWENPGQATVSDKEMAFDFAKKTKHFSNDGIFFMSYFNDGWVFMSSLVGWEYSPLNIKKFAVYVLISDPNGKRYWATTELLEKDIVTKPDRVYLKAGNNYVDGRGMTYKVHYDFGGIYCDLTYKDVLKPWIPGDGWIFPTGEKDIYNHYMMNCPWADVTGTIKLNGKAMKVLGQGYSDRSISQLPPTRQNPYLYSLRLFSPESTPREDRWFFGLLESVTHEAYGSKRLPILLLAHGNDWVLTSRKYTLEPSDYVKGPGTPYEYPTTLTIRSKDQGYIVDMKYTGTKLFDFTDILGELPMWVRKIARKFLSMPVFFRTLGEIEGIVKSPDGKVTKLHLHGPFEYMVVK